VSRLVARELGELRGVGDGGEVLVVGYREPSLVFLMDGDVRFVSVKRAAELCVDDEGVVVVITKVREEVFSAALAARGYRAVEKGKVVTGYRYSNGRWVSIIMMREFVVDVRVARGGDRLGG